ncbi:YheV family putative zinc ribbon protein [Thalassotalea sp. Y01]|uniref:YheV family putative zinc ribbon protein n=1 Tax=Thalassotalea sp. Y01 TaxID=2729613 RepID=UPI00145E41A9|nr:YheV family putative zinc ribbon protein [Thalassotalea sp. Y01]NMP15997.1 YheV family putative metal-binding protein [Thalassotalea sp. Y01]
MKKRFIAGAKCPECNAMDTLALYKEDGVEKVTCVSCGMLMTQPDEKVAPEVRGDETVIGVFKP